MNSVLFYVTVDTLLGGCILIHISVTDQTYEEMFSCHEQMTAHLIFTTIIWSFCSLGKLSYNVTYINSAFEHVVRMCLEPKPKHLKEHSHKTRER